MSGSARISSAAFSSPDGGGSSQAAIVSQETNQTEAVEVGATSANLSPDESGGLFR